MTARTQLEYYTANQIDPVPIALDTQEKWSAHVAKRRNLYERHLGIPLSLLRGQRVLEFGCHSGENALVLADAGASLTLVEPNATVHERLQTLFAAFGQTRAIESLSAATIESFSPPTTGFDVVIAEGFLFTLANRETMLERLFRLTSPRGIVITSYNDSYGMMIEAIKRAVLKRACELASISNWEDRASLRLAEDLFLQEFSRIPVSRPFEAWWRDMLVCPFITAPYFWTLTDLLPIAERAGFGVLGTSPRFDAAGHHTWYKAVPSRLERQARLEECWRRAFPVFLSGMSAAVDKTTPASTGVLMATRAFVGALSGYTTGDVDVHDIAVPGELTSYIAGSADAGFRAVGRDLEETSALLMSSDVAELKARYEGLRVLRSSWGMPYHYVSFIAE